jgi:protein SCO1/2
MLATGTAWSRKQQNGTMSAPLTTVVGGAGTTRMVHHYVMPEVPLVDQDGLPAQLHDQLQHQGPVLMNFIFTTCPGICPILSAIFARTAALLGEDLAQTRLWSISIDPDFDTPERLSTYGAQLNAPPEWRFFTGQPMAVRMIRQAFDTDSDNKMAHRSLILLRTEDDLWIRFEGDISPDHLVAAVHANLRDDQ